MAETMRRRGGNSDFEHERERMGRSGHKMTVAEAGHLGAMARWGDKYGRVNFFSFSAFRHFRLFEAASEFDQERRL